MIYTLAFDQAAIAIIGEALGQMPHRAVAALIGNIQQQINEQEAAVAEAAAAASAAAAPSREIEVSTSAAG
jgi:ubiquinone biosynthesis protein UbiJ